ncbi:MAG: hypothetical protein M1360_04005 [Candidatus Marsarchaeota archaeon]|jgi:hypothetical protein|nr:hypothetical protein [Candidatus Marsarchaeota archaeon]MCL5419074.1 hypothetical protein [Candidatus Marsarchaeota archaeon]
MLVIVPIVLSIGAIYAFIPIIIIIILIAAAAGLMRGTDIFALLGIGTIMGMASGAGRGAGKGLSAGNKYRSTPGKAMSGTLFGTSGKSAKAKVTDERRERAKQMIPDLDAKINNPMMPLNSPSNGSVRLSVFNGKGGARKLRQYNKAKKVISTGKGNVAKATRQIKRLSKGQAKLDSKNWRNEWKNIKHNAREESKKNFKDQFKSRSTKTPFFGDIFALMAAPGAIKKATTEAAKQNVNFANAKKGGYKKEEWLEFRMERMEDKKTKAMNDKSYKYFNKKFNPRVFSSKTPSGVRQLNVELRAEALSRGGSNPMSARADELAERLYNRMGDAANIARQKKDIQKEIYWSNWSSIVKRPVKHP